MTADESPGKAADSLIVLNLGKHKRKRVKGLLKGTGPLTSDVHAAVEQMRKEGTLRADSQVVVVVVREKKKSLSLF